MTDNYENVVMHCVELLTKAHTVQAEENQEAVLGASRALGFCGLEMKRLDAEGKTMLQTKCF